MSAFMMQAFSKLTISFHLSMRVGELDWEKKLALNISGPVGAWSHPPTLLCNPVSVA
jgi:hypothetical protein